MKEDVLTVLMYLFENYLDEDDPMMPSEDDIKGELTRAGFQSKDVTKAFTWLEDLAALKEQPLTFDETPDNTIRVFSREEQERFDTDAMGFVHYLEQAGVLDGNSREMVIERAMALDTRVIDLEQLKWVVLMVLFNIPGSEAAYTWMQDVVFDEQHPAH